MSQRNHKSYGDWISTMSFLGVAVYASLKGFQNWDADNFIRSLLLHGSSFLCLLGAFRYPIARFFDEINKRRQ